MAKEITTEIVKAKDYYTHKWATGYVLIVNGQLHIHGNLKDVKEAKERIINIFKNL
jgi:hypothetical protein